jgi:Tfp pilus assembly protein PilF
LAEVPANDISWFASSLIPWLALLVTLGVGVVLYGFTLRFPFQFDDDSYLLKNPLLHSFGNFLSLFDFHHVRELVRMHQQPEDVGTNVILRPFAYLTFLLNWLVAGGWSPAGCRAVNIAIHCLNGFLVFKLLSQLLRLSSKARDLRPSSSLFIPAVVAGLFMVHPMQVESVTYVAQRFTSLGAFFYLLTLILYFQSNAMKAGRAAKWVRAGSVVALVLGMFSKEEVFTAPLMMVFLDRVIMDRPWKAAFRRALPHLLCLPILPVLIMGLALSDRGHSSSLLHAVCIACPLDQWDYTVLYFFTELKVIVIYLGLLIAPQRLNVDWDVAGTNTLLDGRVLLSLAVMAAMLSSAWMFYRRSRREIRHALLFTGVVWFFATISASSSIVPLPDAMAEHRVYLPSIGILAVLACVADMLRTEFFRNRRIAWAVPVGMACWMVGLGAATMVRNEVWRSGISLWTDATLKSPRRFRTWGNLGVYHAKEKRMDDARACFEKAIALKNDFANGYLNLSFILVQQKKFAESIRVSQAGLHYCGENAAMHFNLAVAFAALGRLEEEERALHEGLAINPGNFLAHVCLGDIYAQHTKFDAAMKEYQTAAKLAPEDKRAFQKMAQIESKTRMWAGGSGKM